MTDNRQDPDWQEDGTKYRIVWGGVLVVGVGFGVAEVQPIPAIILAQALDGVILPIVAIYLFLMVNSTTELGPDMINSLRYNALMGLVVFITIVLGVTNVLEALNNLFAAPLVGTTIILVTSFAVALLLAWPIVKELGRLRDREGTASGFIGAGEETLD